VVRDDPGGVGVGVEVGAAFVEVFDLTGQIAISVTSYNGMLYFGINADRDAMSDVDLLPGLLSQSLDELLEASR